MDLSGMQAVFMVEALVGIGGLGVRGVTAGTDPISVMKSFRTVAEDDAGEIGLVVPEEAKRTDEEGIHAIACELLAGSAGSAGSVAFGSNGCWSV